jgi:hypothetical protein
MFGVEIISSLARGRRQQPLRHARQGAACKEIGNRTGLQLLEGKKRKDAAGEQLCRAATKLPRREGGLGQDGAAARMVDARCARKAAERRQKGRRSVGGGSTCAAWKEGNCLKPGKNPCGRDKTAHGGPSERSSSCERCTRCHWNVDPESDVCF